MAVAIPWHAGEAAMHELLKVPRQDNPTHPGLPGPYGRRIAAAHLIALGALDARRRPWATVWGGESGTAGPIAPGVLGIRSEVDGANDPVFQSLWRGNAKGIVGPDRVKFAGRMVVGSATEGEGEEEEEEKDQGARGKVLDVQIGMEVRESLGNCPKYINRRDLVRNEMRPETTGKGLPLSEAALGVVGKADLFFLATVGGRSMDVNIRGGCLVGITIPDFETSDVTGSADILIGDAASSILGRTNVAVKITVDDARFVNPPVRPLVSEQASLGTVANSQGRPELTATFVKREFLSPTVARVAFTLSSDKPLPTWKSGQAITFDFRPELSRGWSHMRDDDPQSLNDDFIRSFTVSSVAPRDVGPGTKSVEFEITVRKHGPATGLLWRWNPRVSLTIPVIGFSGEEGFLMPTETAEEASVFVAAGVGITPLIAQADAVLASGNKLKVLWSAKAEDLPLVDHLAGAAAELKTKIESMGAKVWQRRITEADVRAAEADGKRKFYLCAAPAMTKVLMKWLEGEDVIYENFNY
ncbi:unnamed protein product [Parascedosporium putredinis]|uniref:FAD-binding FR-type domain-containing protein n=1 Tax=Parascedosporium putredinis TaxID=1442378 RepID=A0A9P1MDZ7_9PEZI|nr:unnamed protein product [Parascedosporium putredinis]CAI8004681.1 unnamed protein product [Parascedosporium putredinis]